MTLRFVYDGHTDQSTGDWISSGQRAVDSVTGAAPTSWEDIQHAKILNGQVDPSNLGDPEVAQFLQQQNQRVAQQRAGTMGDSIFANGAINAAAMAMMGMGAGAAVGGYGAAAGANSGEIAGASGSGGGAGGGGMYLDDYGNPMDFTSSGGGSGSNWMSDPTLNGNYYRSWDTTSPGANVPYGSGSTDWGALFKEYGPMAKQLAPLLGAGLGAAAGGIGGGSQPAGNVTSTQDVPAWLKPYVQGNLNAGGNVLNSLNPNSQNPLLPAAQAEAAKTINGDYLNPDSNPYFKQSVNDALGLAQSNFTGMYGGAAGGNLNNSGFQESLARGLGATATNAYAQNYSNERQRQATAAFGAPQMVAQSSEAAFSPLKSYAGLFPNVQSTTQPYFNNPLGSIFSGALGGAALGRAFG